MKKILLFVLLFSLATVSLARPFLDVTSALLSVVPETEKELRKDLERFMLAYKITINKTCDASEDCLDDKLREYLIYIISRAPETYVSLIWEDLAVYLSNRYPNRHELIQWQITMLDIFMGTLDYTKYLDIAWDTKKTGACTP
jgi:hypothetical protein